MNRTLEIGMIGLDTSHATAFTELLNDIEHPYHVPGGQVVCAYPGGSPDVSFEYGRLDSHARIVQEQYGVEIKQSIEEVASEVDAILLESADGRVHWEQFTRLAPFGKPIFIDKPLAVSLEDALKIRRLAKEYHVPVMSSSALRYSSGLHKVLSSTEEAVSGVSCYGPMYIEPSQPGYFWYGIHTAEMLFRIMGPGCREVTVHAGGDHDQIIGAWNDGRIGTIRGFRSGVMGFGALLHRERHTELIDTTKDEQPFYAGLLEKVIKFFATGIPDVPLDETLEIIRFIEAANDSVKSGKTVTL
ncbi:Gfo/Idh/MocA family oxidoreductase [Paenibacillus sp. GD4]|uniref:Gfo/Idh/MocA family protein n=1 Tax=Paenibacillus sp. GD4 TaxID=3068890 RepID=UPI0027969B65|nr:Gfo/Idh/MocA family oxidoreductase [Paenibacillus sp. GD4]MDQ1913512.1 Gfo/Idh/MocA family oxidoreductase [Paenibacillus sp. GD4]